MMSPLSLLIVVVVVLHAVAAVGWMTSAGFVARGGGVGAERAYAPQMMHALFVLISGGFLWSRLHAGAAGLYEITLGAGALCAVAAAVIQGGMVGPAVRRLKAAGEAAGLRKTMARGNAIASALLMLAFVCMIAARFL